MPQVFGNVSFKYRKKVHVARGEVVTHCKKRDWLHANATTAAYRQMANLEAMPGGMAAMERMFHDVHEPMMGTE
jgi:hypothetical protein